MFVTGPGSPRAQHPHGKMVPVLHLWPVIEQSALFSTGWKVTSWGRSGVQGHGHWRSNWMFGMPADVKVCWWSQCVENSGLCLPVLVPQFPYCLEHKSQASWWIVLFYILPLTLCRIQQIQLLGRDMKGAEHDKLWNQLEAEIHLHRHKTVIRACRGRSNKKKRLPIPMGHVRHNLHLSLILTNKTSSPRANSGVEWKQIVYSVDRCLSSKESSVFPEFEFKEFKDLRFDFGFFATNLRVYYSKEKVRILTIETLGGTQSPFMMQPHLGLSVPTVSKSRI